MNAQTDVMNGLHRKEKHVFYIRTLVAFNKCFKTGHLHLMTLQKSDDQTYSYTKG
jgi:hypothetical protein